jgi:hypothetical protein
MASSCRYDDGKSGPTHCAVIGAARGDRVMQLRAGDSSRHVRNLAPTAPAVARPAGNSPNTRAAQRITRCTGIKRDVVWTLGGARQTRTVCVRRRDTRPHAESKGAHCGWGSSRRLSMLATACARSSSTGLPSPRAQHVGGFVALAATVFG